MFTYPFTRDLNLSTPRKLDARQKDALSTLIQDVHFGQETHIQLFFLDDTMYRIEIFVNDNTMCFAPDIPERSDGEKKNTLNGYYCTDF